VTVTPTLSVAVWPKLSENVTAHEPDVCEVTVNCAGELVVLEGDTTATTPHAPAFAVIGPE
jgi:hypothetical protein